MKNSVVKVALFAALLFGAAACASSTASRDLPPVTTEAPPPVDTNRSAPIRNVDTRPSGPVVTGPAAGTIEDFRVNVGERVYFDTDSYSLDAQDRETLDRQASWLASYPSVNIMVAGNCDERGTREYNLALGDRRANSVKDYLVSKGIRPSRIETISFGKERPLDPRSTSAAWQINRNGYTQILNGRNS